MKPPSNVSLALSQAANDIRTVVGKMNDGLIPPEQAASDIANIVGPDHADLAQDFKLLISPLLQQ